MSIAGSKQGLLLVISGPSGVGKGTICKRLMADNPAIKMSVSATTRAPRKGEVEGVNYFFKTVEEFQQLIEQDAFLEYMRVFGSNYYGTPKSYVEQQRAAGHDVILEIDVQGAAKVRAGCPDAVLIYIAPPDPKTLRDRLVGRGTETAEAIVKRTIEACREISRMGDYDYIVVNDQLDAAVDGVEAILAAERLRVSRNEEMIKHLQGGF